MSSPPERGVGEVFLESRGPSRVVLGEIRLLLLVRPNRGQVSEVPLGELLETNQEYGGGSGPHRPEEYRPESRVPIGIDASQARCKRRRGVLDGVFGNSAGSEGCNSPSDSPPALDVLAVAVQSHRTDSQRVSLSGKRSKSTDTHAPWRGIARTNTMSLTLSRCESSIPQADVFPVSAEPATTTEITPTLRSDRKAGLTVLSRDKCRKKNAKGGQTRLDACKTDTTPGLMSRSNSSRDHSSTSAAQPPQSLERNPCRNENASSDASPRYAADHRR